MSSESLALAAVVSGSPQDVWSEIRDFIASVPKFFGIPAENVLHTNPAVAASDEVGCVRQLTVPGGSHVLEELVEHSDELMRFSYVIPGEANILNVRGYRATIGVSGLGDGTSSLVKYDGSWDSETTMKPVISGSLSAFLKELSLHFEKASAAVEIIAAGAGPLLSVGRFAGKVALVTGGAQGLGHGMATALSAGAARVVIADRSAEKAQAAASGMPGGAYAVMDVTSCDAVHHLIQQIAATYGRLDIVVNNAGVVSPPVKTAKFPLSEWQRIIDVNLNGAFFVLRESLAQMSSQEPSGGVVVNVASTAGLVGLGGIAPYTAAKAALIALTKSTAAEYAAEGIRVCAVAPTGVDTELVRGFMENMTETQRAGMMTMNPKPGMPTVKDVASVVAFLCSDEAKWVSGSTVPVDGAYCAGPKPPA